MQKLIKNSWLYHPTLPFSTANILNHQTHPEGLDVHRIRFTKAGILVPNPKVGHIISVYRGNAQLRVKGYKEEQYRLVSGVHLFLPCGVEAEVVGDVGTEMMKVSSPTAEQVRGKQLLLRDETFLAACATESHSLRWTFTPQYLSRRIFLHHDETLLSQSGNPVSWFRTTMFDVAGLPENEEGEPVFKMSYNSRTEFNVCYDVQGHARVRMAQHPYKESQQAWGPWHLLDSDSTYHLNEASGCAEEECYFNKETQESQFFRNKHEVHIANGYVTLFCLFDPAPTGIEAHHIGQYSDYQPLSRIVGTKLYQHHQQEIAKFDEMVDRLSVAKAAGALSTMEGTQVWETYLQGHAAQSALEQDIVRPLVAEGKGREQVLAEWMLTPMPQNAAPTRGTDDSLPPRLSVT